MKPLQMAACFFLLAFPSWLQAQDKSNHEVPKSLPIFVQEFYDWYVPIALRDDLGPASDYAVREKPSAFSHELLCALKADSQAQASLVGETVGLDFDPFLSSQDPCERYEIGKITRKGRSYLVEVYSACSGKRREKPNVIIELVLVDGSWVFVNFRYPIVGGDLLTTLKDLRKSREKLPHKKAN